MMVLSAIPAACNLAIFSLAGLEKLHSSMAQVATVSVQPHWQPICAPTRRTSTLGFSAAVSAKARGSEQTAMASIAQTAEERGLTPAPAKARPPTSLGDFGIFGSDSDHFGAGVLHFDFAGDQAH